MYLSLTFLLPLISLLFPPSTSIRIFFLSTGDEYLLSLRCGGSVREMGSTAELSEEAGEASRLLWFEEYGGLGKKPRKVGLGLGEYL